VWADNASDFKGGDMWAQWRKELGEGGVASDLCVVELDYHAAGEGKAMLDGHFGTLKTLRHKQERMKVERHDVEDLLNSMAAGSNACSARGVEARGRESILLDWQGDRGPSSRGDYEGWVSGAEKIG
jgi:hypothetical protein